MFKKGNIEMLIYQLNCSPAPESYIKSSTSPIPESVTLFGNSHHWLFKIGSYPWKVGPSLKMPGILIRNRKDAHRENTLWSHQERVTQLPVGECQRSPDTCLVEPGKETLRKVSDLSHTPVPWTPLLGEAVESSLSHAGWGPAWKGLDGNHLS